MLLNLGEGMHKRNKGLGAWGRRNGIDIESLQRIRQSLVNARLLSKAREVSLIRKCLGKEIIRIIGYQTKKVLTKFRNPR